MYSGTFNAHSDSQVDGGPAGIRLSTVTAALVPWAPQGPCQRRVPREELAGVG